MIGWIERLLKRKTQQPPPAHTMGNGIYYPVSILSNSTRKISVFHWAIIKIRANAVATLKWDVVVERNGTKIPVDALENKIARSFWKPNDNLTTTELLSNLVLFLDLYGNAFLRVEDIGESFRLTLINPATANVLRDGSLYSNGIVIPREEVVFFRAPLFDWSRAGSFGLDAGTLLRPYNEALESIALFLRNFSATGGGNVLYITGANLTPQQRENLIREWNTRFPNSPLGIVIDTGEVKSSPVSISSNLDAISLVSKFPMQMISSFYGVPLGKVTGENANYATAAINDYTFWTTSVKPTALLISDTLTDYFRRFQSDIWITFSEMDFSALEMFRSPKNVVTRAYDEMSIHIPHVDPNIEWKALDRIASSSVSNFEKAYKTFWRDVEMLVYSLLPDDQTRAYQDVAVSIRAEELFQLLRNLLGRDLSVAFKRSIQHAFKTLGQSITQDDYQIIESRVFYYTERQLQTWVENWTRNIQDAITVSQDRDQLTNNLERTFQEMSSRPRIQMQARQTATIAVNSSLHSTFEMFPEYDVVWLSQRDGRVRPTHILADGQKRENGYFTVGGEKLLFPGAGTIPENNINCRCYIRPVRRVS